MHGLLLNHGKTKWSYINSLVTNPVNCVITSRETTCQLSLWKQEFIVSLSEIPQEFTNKEGKKSSWSTEQLFFLLKIILSPSPTPKSIFHLITLEGICLKYVLLFYQISLIYLMHCAMIKVYHLSSSSSALFLLTVFTKTRLGVVYLLGGGSYFLLCFYSMRSCA